MRVIAGLLVMLAWSVDARAQKFGFDLDVPAGHASSWDLVDFGQWIHGVTAKVRFDSVRTVGARSAPQFAVGADGPRGFAAVVFVYRGEGRGIVARLIVQPDSSVPASVFAEDSSYFPGRFEVGDTIKVQVRWAPGEVTGVVNGYARTLRFVDRPNLVTFVALNAEVTGDSVSYLGATGDSAAYQFILDSPVDRNTHWRLSNPVDMTGLSLGFTIAERKTSGERTPMVELFVDGKEVSRQDIEEYVRLAVLAPEGDAPWRAILSAHAWNAAAKDYVTRDSIEIPGSFKLNQRINVAMQWSGGSLTANVNGQSRSVRFAGPVSESSLYVTGAKVTGSRLRWGGW